MIGRLPNRSDNTPSNGEKINCIRAKTTANHALHFAASVICPPRKSRINFGRTGMIKPIARMSRVTVTRIKIRAAWRDFKVTSDEWKKSRNFRLVTCHPSFVTSWMLRLSYLSPKTEVRESPIHGRGLFAKAKIKKDEIVAIKGGHIVDRKTLQEKISPQLGPVEIQIDDDLFIAPVTPEERELSMLYSNHSCDANLGVRGEISFVAMREIQAGEELTHDWSTTDDDDY